MEITHRDIADLRGINTPCKTCNGLGVRSYCNTATWRGGIGGSAITQDVCDKCWGSGDHFRPWLSLRRVDALFKAAQSIQKWGTQHGPFEAEDERLWEALDRALAKPEKNP